jgi:hypothetical protein
MAAVGRSVLTPGWAEATLTVEGYAQDALEIGTAFMHKPPRPVQSDARQERSPLDSLQVNKSLRKLKQI